MKIVIDIPKGLYYSVVDGCADECTKALQSAFKNGTPLPKGHGRLIDADKLHHCECKGNFNECDTCLDDDLCNLVNEAPTIIEADEEGAEEQDKKKKVTIQAWVERVNRIKTKKGTAE